MATIMDEIETAIDGINLTRSRFKVEVPLTALYGIILITGVLGNITTCIVIAQNRITNTATNYYLFSLAISDLLVLLCGMPLDVYRLWQPFSYPLGEYLCITLGLISETSANVTVLTITAFTVDRYVAIHHPFMSHNLSKLSRVVKYIIAIWICSLCFAVPQVMQYGIVNYEENGQFLSVCTMKVQGGHQVFVISSFVFFFLPMSLIIILYVLIGIKIRTSCVLLPLKNSSGQNVERCNGTRQYRNGASQRKVIRMLVAVTLSCFVCWAPFHVQSLIAIYGESLEHSTDTFYKVYEFLTYRTGVLYYVSTSINPLLYNIMSRKFRRAFKVTLLSWCCRQARPPLGRTSRPLQRFRHPQQQSRQSRPTASSQQCDAPPPPEQSPDQTKLATIYEENEFEFSSTSPESISNSSLREVDQQLSREELTTYLYQVNKKIAEKTCDSSV